MNYYDENGNLVASTTFTDAQGRYVVDGLEVTKEEYEEATKEVQSDWLSGLIPPGDETGDDSG